MEEIKENVITNDNNIEEKPKKPQGFAVCPENINRKGRPPKEWTWSQIIEDTVNELGDDNLGVRNEKLKKTMVKKMVKKVLSGDKGDVLAFRELTNRSDGLPKQIIEGDINLYKLNIVRHKDKPEDKILRVLNEF